MVVGPHKTNLNVYFWRDWMKEDVTVMSQRIRVTIPLLDFHEILHIVGQHKTNLNVYFWHDCLKDDVTVTSQKFNLLR